MKKFIPLIITLIFAITAVFLFTSCSREGEDFVYSSENGELTITGYKGDGGVVEIPEAILTEKVTKIGKAAFKDNDNVTKIVIPDSVTEIEAEAFYRAGALTEVVMGNGVTTVGEKAFFNCVSLKTVDLSDNLNYENIADNTFENCSSLESIDLPDATLAGQDAEKGFLSAYGLKIRPDYAVKYTAKDGEEKSISFDYFYYIYRLFQNQFDQSDENFWNGMDKSNFSLLLDYTLENIKRDYVLYQLYEELPEGERQRIKSDFDNYLSKDVSDAAVFESEHPNEYHGQFCQYYLTLLYDELFETEERTEWVKNKLSEHSKGTYKIEHVFISFDNHSKEEALKIAEEVSAISKSVSDFSGLISQYGEDDAMRSDGKGETVETGTLDVSYAAELKEMEAGDISDVVETNIGYYIIHKLESDESDLYPYVFVDYIFEKFGDTATEYNNLLYKVTPKTLY